MQNDPMDIQHLLELARMTDENSPDFIKIMEEIIHILEKHRVSEATQDKIRVFKQKIATLKKT